MQKHLLTTACAVLLGASASAVTIDWVMVGNPGNACDPQPEGCIGSVDYRYTIGTFEVTNAQYAEFLNAADPGGVNPSMPGENQGIYDPRMASTGLGGIAFDAGAAAGSKYSVKPNFGDKPVLFVSWFHAARFVNWLENGQPLGGSGLLTGSYDLTEAVYNDSATYASLARDPAAHWVIPSIDEWHKAAYFSLDDRNGDPGFWTYPTQSDFDPFSAHCNSSGGVTNPGSNVTNHGGGCQWNGEAGNVSSVGSAQSSGFYGTFDQAGNVLEWNDRAPEFELVWVDEGSAPVRGGSWDQPAENLSRLKVENSHLTARRDNLGFRVAYLPESSSTIVINNGLAPPNPANVIDASNSFSDASLFVHDVGCDATISAGGDPDSYQGCDLSGTPTIVEMVVGGQIGDPTNTPSGAGALDVFDTSSFIMSGGFVRFNIFVRQSASLHVSGGRVEEDLRLQDSAIAIMSGGSVDNIFASEFSQLELSGGTLRISATDAGLLVAQGSAVISVVGSNFAVNGTPAALGPLAASTGRLTGALASGDAIDNVFIREQDGQILLVAEPPACNDGLDNDMDGLADWGGGDPGCHSMEDDSEKSADLPCDDGIDNETSPDGLVDFRVDALGDPGCLNPIYFTEAPQCQDGINNDLETGIDFDGGLSVWGIQVDQPDPNCVGRPWHNREAPPPRCGLGMDLVFPLVPLMWARRRRANS